MGAGARNEGETIRTGPAAKACIPHLKMRLVDHTLVPHPWIEQSERGLVERAAAWTAGRMGPPAAEHIDILIGLMHSRAYPEVVEAIGRIGPVQENIVPNIVEAMEREEGSIWRLMEPYWASRPCKHGSKMPVPHWNA